MPAYFRRAIAGAGGIPGRNGTQYTYDVDGHTDRIGQCIFDDVQKGVWYDVVHNIKWSYTGTGSHEIWMRKAGEAPQGCKPFGCLFDALADEFVSQPWRDGTKVGSRMCRPCRQGPGQTVTNVIEPLPSWG